MPPLSLVVHTEYVENFVVLSPQESVVRDKAERVSDALVKAGSRHLVPWALAPS